MYSSVFYGLFCMLHLKLYYNTNEFFPHHTTCESMSDNMSKTSCDNTVLVAQGGTATPGATKQLLPPDRVFNIYIYIHIHIYMPDQLKGEITLDVHLHF